MENETLQIILSKLDNIDRELKQLVIQGAQIQEKSLVAEAKLEELEAKQVTCPALASTSITDFLAKNEKNLRVLIDDVINRNCKNGKNGIGNIIDLIDDYSANGNLFRVFNDKYDGQSGTTIIRSLLSTISVDDVKKIDKIVDGYKNITKIIWIMASAFFASFGGAIFLVIKFWK